jgi:flagellar basal-body rod modification protein FlgD
MATTIAAARFSAGPTTDGTSTREAKGSQDLGKDEFLRLLITQLRYQDPINPSKPEEFASQLAQFTSLERMQNIEDILAGQSESNALTTLAMKADLGASFIGRQVLAAGDTLSVGEDGKAVATVDVGSGGGKTTVTVYDESGKEVLSKEMGFRSGGRQVLTLGTLPKGSYSYKVTATSTSGAEVPVQTYTAGIVDGVSFQGGTIILKSGTLTFPLDNVVEVERAPAGAAALAAVSNARIIPSPTE